MNVRASKDKSKKFVFYFLFRLKVPHGSTTELSHKGSQFFTKLFWRFDKDRDGALSPVELSQLFTTCPAQAWGTDIQNIVPTNEKVIPKLLSFSIFIIHNISHKINCFY